ncbi:MAG: hypothetical protein IKF52_04540 [Clostridia bacterium]|nr:hypothetical protein [Clostridia bacterium]
MKEKKTEKKTFILAVPTVIIIIVFLIAMPVMIYRKNFKPLSRDEAITLSEKNLSIDNISCEVITKSNDEKVVDYKFKDNTLYSNYNDSTIELTEEDKCTYVDLKEKELYTYNSKNNIDNFKSVLNSAREILENDDYEYEFKKYEKINGIKAATFSLKKDGSEFTISLDRETGMPLKIDGEYYVKNEDKTDSITTIFRYQIGQVKDEDLKLPDTEGYNIVNMN